MITCSLVLDEDDVWVTTWVLMLAASKQETKINERFFIFVCFYIFSRV